MVHATSNLSPSLYTLPLAAAPSSFQCVRAPWSPLSMARRRNIKAVITDMTHTGSRDCAERLLQVTRNRVSRVLESLTPQLVE